MPPREVVGRSVILVECSGAKVRRFHGGTDQMGFANPRPLYMWENNRNNMAGRLERVDEGMDVGGGLVRRRTVVVCDLGLLQIDWLEDATSRNV